MSSTIKNRLPFLMLLIPLLALAIYLSLPKQSEEKKRNQRVVSVKTVNVVAAKFRDVVEALGTSRANEQVLITSKYSDIVDKVEFKDGQLVKKNDVLVRLNNQEAKAKVKELEANLAESVAQLNRFQGLLDKKATSKSEVDQQDAKTKAIAAQLLSAKTKFNDLTIKAPFDGVLGFREVSNGAYIKSGDIITSLDDLSIIKVDFAIPERFFTTIKVGQIINAENSAYDKKNFVGKITSIDSRIDSITRTVKVRAEIPNPDYSLRPGMLVHVTVERRVDTVLQVPESAIIPIEDRHFVYVIEESTAKRLAVEVGRRKPGIVEIKGGLTAGQSVVVEGALKLRDGSQVNVLEK